MKIAQIKCSNAELKRFGINDVLIFSGMNVILHKAVFSKDYGAGYFFGTEIGQRGRINDMPYWLPEYCFKNIVHLPKKYDI